MITSSTMMLTTSLARRSVARKLQQPPMAAGVIRRSITKQPVLPKVTEQHGVASGTGGRHSDAQLKVAIFGATGFVGRYLCEFLGQNGVLAYIGNRGCELEVRDLKVSFDLGRSRFVFYEPRDRASVADVIADADIVVNLIGKYYETKQPVQVDKFPYIGYKTNYSFENANVDIPRTLAELCVEMQVDNFIHVSSAAARPDHPSEWARTKYEGEQVVKEIYPWATIIRPTQLFGAEDRFLNFFARFAAKFPVVPLIDGGHALTQPVWAVNVAETIARVCDAPELFEGKQIDCFGPADYSYKELAQFVFDITGQEPWIEELPKSYALQYGKLAEYERNPLLTPDLVHLWSEDYLPTFATQEEYEAANDRIYTMKDLGIEALPVEKEAFNYLHRFRKGGHFVNVEGYH